MHNYTLLSYVCVCVCIYVSVCVCVFVWNRQSIKGRILKSKEITISLGVCFRHVSFRTMYDGFCNLLKMYSGRKCFLNIYKANKDSIVFHSINILNFRQIYVRFWLTKPVSIFFPWKVVIFWNMNSFIGVLVNPDGVMDLLT